MEKEYNSDLFKRLITSLIIALPIILIAFLQNFWFFFAIITLACSFALHEWIKNGFRHPIAWGFTLIFLYFWLSLNILIGISSADNSLLGMSLDNLSIYLLFLIIICNTAIFDTFAYLIGSKFGKTSIAPTISPNKTLEGLAGGLIANASYSFLICFFLDLSYWLVLSFIIGGLLAFFGDLLISFHKREKGIKDTGTILPGHGGILDRLDSHLVALPITISLAILLI